MAASMLHIFSLVLILSIFKPSVALTEVLKNKICSQTGDSKLCLDILNNDPRTISPSADLYGTASAALNLAFSIVSDAQNFIKSKPELQVCSNGYGEVVRDLNQANGYLSSHDYRSLNLAAGGAVDFIEACDKKLKGVNPLAERNHKAFVVISIVGIIANMNPA
ncbi:hypothetical protein ACHQM5_014529 [Ranunculus cassubicifolius]